MNMARFLFAATVVFLLGGSLLLAQQAEMSFFITSKGPGRGADLGGLAGADRHCQMLAEAAGAGSRSWRAYLSTSPSRGGGSLVDWNWVGDCPDHHWLVEKPLWPGCLQRFLDPDNLYSGAGFRLPVHAAPSPGGPGVL